jgi:hypothetical protein
MDNMDWAQVLVIMFGNAAWTIPMLIWFRTESRNDWRHMDTQVRVIQEEIKDFHGRLCAIEERYRNK